MIFKSEFWIYIYIVESIEMQIHVKQTFIFFHIYLLGFDKTWTPGSVLEGRHRRPSSHCGPRNWRGGGGATSPTPWAASRGPDLTTLGSPGSAVELQSGWGVAKVRFLAGFRKDFALK